MAGQALEQSDNPAKTYPQAETPKGWSLKMPTYRRLKMLINQTTKAHPRNDKPLGLDFWKGRRWSKATTLSKHTRKRQPLRVGLLAGQALEQSDNPAKTYPQAETPKGWSLKMPTYRRLKMLINQTTKAHPRNDKPLGLDFWKGRRWSKATTLSKHTHKRQPLRVGLSTTPHIAGRLY